MELHFTQDQEAHLSHIAARDGKANACELLRDAALRMIDRERQFEADVLEGIACANRGEFIEEEEMDELFAKMLES